MNLILPLVPLKPRKMLHQSQSLVETLFFTIMVVSYRDTFRKYIKTLDTLKMKRHKTF